MTLPNAAKGVKKMFIAEILQLIAAVLLLISAISLGAGVVSAFDGNEGAATGAFATGGIFGTLGIILPLIALILSLVGMWQASKDEPDRMKKAFWFAIATLVLGVLQGFVFTDFWSLFDEANWNWAGFLSTLESLAEMCMMIFAIMGVSEVTQNIAREDVADMGPKVITISVVAIAIAIIAPIFGTIIGGIASIISLVCMVAAYIVYLVFLGKASSALSKA